MEEQKNMGNMQGGMETGQSAGDQEPKSGSGALVAIIIIIIVLVIGGFYFFGSLGTGEDVDMDSQTEELLNTNDSDEVDAIQQDLDSTELDGLDSELGDDTLLE